MTHVLYFAWQFEWNEYILVFLYGDLTLHIHHLCV